MHERPDIADLEWFPGGAYAPRILSEEEIRAVEDYLASLVGIELEEE